MMKTKSTKMLAATAVAAALLAGAVDAATIREPTLTVVLARDPKAKLLRFDPAIAEWQAWTKAQDTAKK